MTTYLRRLLKKPPLYIYYLHLATNKMIATKFTSPIQASCEGLAHVVRRVNTACAKGILPYNI